MWNSPPNSSRDALFADINETIARQHYQHLLDAVSDGAYRLDSDFRFVAATDTFLALTGYTRENLLGTHLSVLLNPTDVERVVNEIAQQRASSTATDVELSIQTATGETVACVVQVGLVSTDAAVQGSVGVIRSSDVASPTKESAAVPQDTNRVVATDDDSSVETGASSTTTPQSSHATDDDSSGERVELHVTASNDREQLEAFNRLYRITQDVVHTVITESTREDLERAVCERLVEGDAYAFAWMGEVQHQISQFAERVSAPADCGFDVAAIPFDDSGDGERPEAKAVRTREIQVVQDIHTAPEFDHCRAQMKACGYQTMAAIPVAYSNVFYGILAIYDESPNAFGDPEQEKLSQLGEIIGHAITAVERKNALVSDTVLQLTFSQENAPAAFGGVAADDWSLAFERLIQTDSGILAYGSTNGISKPELETLVDQSTLVQDLRILSPGPAEFGIELTTSWGTQLIPALAQQGGHVTGMTITEDELQFVVEVPPGRDKHQLVALVEEHCPDATLRSQLTVPRDDPAITDFHLAFKNRLTAKQRAALKTAFHAGYFEWPRQSTGEEVADRLGISQATFSEHFRGAEQILFEAVFGTDASDDTGADSPWNSSEPDPKS